MGWWWQVKVAGAMKRREVASEVSFKLANEDIEDMCIPDDNSYTSTCYHRFLVST